MSNIKYTKRECEANLTLQQRKAALLLVENELSDEPSTWKTQDEIADEIGISRMTLYRWRTDNDYFMDYVNIIGQDFLKTKQNTVFKRLFGAIDNNKTSIKAIELFLKLQGLLKDSTEIEIKGGNGRSEEDLRKSLKEIDALLNDVDDRREEEPAIRLGDGLDFDEESHEG